MSKFDWFRRTTWTDTDREEFYARLQRSRGDSNKAQYLRIQACHLAESEQYEAAIELLDRLFTYFPNSIDDAQAHTQKAESLAKLGRTDEAISEYRAALQRQREFPNVRTNAWLDFGWFVLEKQLVDLFGEVSKVLDEFLVPNGLPFPVSEYRYYAIQSLLADARADMERAKDFAEQALAAASKKHSGYRYHPTVGQVGKERDIFTERLKSLSGH